MSRRGLDVRGVVGGGPKEEVALVMELFLMRVATMRETGAPVACYLIRTDDGTDLLVDTGVPLPPEEGAPWEADAADGVVAQLARVGVEPRDVDYVVCSHLDPDHAGNNDAFPGATFVVQRRQYEAARSGRYPRFEVARGRWDRPEQRYRRSRRHRVHRQWESGPEQRHERQDSEHRPGSARVRI